jgi:putative transposase
MSSRNLPSGHRALRAGRFSEPDRIYLVTTVTLGRVPWFADHIVATAVAQRHQEPATFAGARILAWVLMPDHWHGLIELDVPVSLSLAMNRFKNISAHAANRCLDRRGPIWARAFHDRAMNRAPTWPPQPCRSAVHRATDALAGVGRAWHRPTSLRMTVHDQ